MESNTAPLPHNDLSSEAIEQLSMRAMRRRILGWVACAAIISVILQAQQTDLAARSDQAKRALAAGKYTEAVTLYRGLCREMPAVAGCVLNLGIALYSAGRYQEAADELERALKLDPNMAPASLLLGLTRARLGQPTLAIAPLEKAVRAEPSNRVALLELADAYLSTGAHKLAVERFQQLAALDPRNPAAWRGLGLSYTGLSRNVFSKLDPDSPPALLLLARSRLAFGEPKTAFALLKRAIEKDPGFPGAHAALAEAYRQTGHPDWAEVAEARERAISRTPDGAYREALEASLQATQAFARLTELPESPELYETESDAARLREAHKESVELMRKAVALRPGDRRLQQELARSLWLDRSYDEALPMLKKHGMDFELGFALLETGKAAEAIPLLERAARGSRLSAEVNAALGRAYLAIGEPAKAIAPLKAVLDTDQDGSLHFQLARAYQRSGQTALALAMDKESQALRQQKDARGERMSQEREITPP